MLNTDKTLKHNIMKETKVQKTVMIDAIVDRIIKAEAKEYDRSYSHVLNDALKKTFKLG